MENKTITIKSAAEIESISAENIKLDAALFSHRRKLKTLIDNLSAELKAIDTAILDSVNHEKVKTDLFYTIISDYTEFDKDRFILENGQKKYDEYKTKPVHREQVRTR